MVMALRLRVAMAQLNMLVGDVPGNVERVLGAVARARDTLHADLVVFPELSLTGYPPEDLLLHAGLTSNVRRGVEALCQGISGIRAIVGYPRLVDGALYNAASLFGDGRVIATYHKQLLPNYSVFDEKRYFTPGNEACVVEVQGVPLGITICEDIWQPEPTRMAAAAGARLLINLNASPFHLGKAAQRERVACGRVAENGVPLVYVNQVGGQDELVFDGASFVCGVGGAIPVRAAAFREEIAVADFRFDRGNAIAEEGVAQPAPATEEAVYSALVLGVQDYIRKNGFHGVVLGLSGGIDSALVLTVAVDALGRDQVEAVMMPSRYTSPMSLEDAEQLARNLGVAYTRISIEPTFQAFMDSLKDEFAGRAPDITEENLQARCRGVLLMAISNKKRKIVLTTGNKSENAVGYATLYGDMAGGFDVLKDVPKTLVFALARYRNALGAVIPQRVIDRPPSAELAPNQKDEDSLPPYAVLDPILELYVERDLPVEDIVAAGYDEATVRRVAKMVDRNEYKRRQAPPGVRITPRAFGKDRRYPITSGYRGKW